MDKLSLIRRKVRSLPFNWSTIKSITINPSNIKGKKYTAIIELESGKKYLTHFGAQGMEDYLDHKDKARRDNFRSRFGRLYEKNKSNYRSGLAFSYPLLW